MRSLKAVALTLLLTAVVALAKPQTPYQIETQNFDDGSYKPELYDNSALFDDGKYRPEDGTQPAEPFDFGYAVKNNGGRNDYGHAESGDGTVTRGQYRILLPNGVVQTVRYQADKERGFQPEITYERAAKAPSANADDQYE